MFKKIRYGIGILSLALSLVTGPAKAAKCDVTFSKSPTFSSMSLVSTQSQVFTITNNTPVAVRINYISLKNNDTFPSAASAIVAAPSNNCIVGSFLAAGASCNIQVNLLSLTSGTFNRVLQVGVDTRQVEIAPPAITATVTNTAPPAAPAPPSPPFPPGFNFTILAGTTVTNTGPSAVNGNVGVSPGTAITGFPPGIIVNGTTHSNDAAAITAQTELTTLYNNLVGQSCTTTLTGQDLGGLTLSPGVYCFASSAQLTGALTLSGSGQYVFKIGSTLTTSTGAQVILTGGATRDQVFWQVGSSATLGSSTQFQGTIAAQTSITLNAGAALLGRALARDGAVTLDTNAVNPS